MEAGRRMAADNEESTAWQGSGWLCDWRGVIRVADMQAQGVRFEWWSKGRY